MRALAWLAAAFVLLTAVAWGILSLTWPDSPVDVNVRWKPDVSETLRVDLERQFQLAHGEHSEGTTWRYQLADASTANIRALIQHSRVDDTAHLNRIRFRPEFGQDRLRQLVAWAIGIGAAGSMLVWALFAWRPAFFRFPSRSEFAASFAPVAPAVASFNARATASAIVAGVLAAAVLTWFSGASFPSVAGALAIVYAGGYVVGSLLLERHDEGCGLSWALIRTNAGLLLTTVGFLLSLVLSLPWFLLPCVLLVATAGLRGARALARPRVHVRPGWDGLAAAILAALILSPILITFAYMAPGSFPPVFFNIDTAYTLEKVHALAVTTIYPPASLSNLGVHRTYHYGTQAMAALISRGSGLPPHQSLFLVVLPLLTMGVVAAAVAAARYISPALPRSVSIPLLLISTPSLSNPLWGNVGLSIGTAIGNYDLWGILSNEGPNVGSDFLILASIAGIAAAPSWGWRLPAFLIGSSILVKTPAGVALFVGFVLAEAWRALGARRLQLSPQLLATGAAFLLTVIAFFALHFESNFRVELYPLFHVREMIGRGFLGGVIIDACWLLLPALIVLSAGIRDPEKRGASFLWMALGALIVVNATRMDNTRPGGGGTGDDWFQMLHTVPFLLHAFVLSVASARWDRLGRARRVAFLLTMVVAIAPVVLAAGSYSRMVVRTPQNGNDFVDNRSLAEALAVIPTSGTVIVTNDLRYPAGHFTRDYRQMQIPALFGHQAFAVNYAHEAVEERRPLQQLLQEPEWSSAILDAARRYHWTHFLVRKDYMHPAAVPLEQVFENPFYAVFRFP